MHISRRYFKFRYIFWDWILINFNFPNNSYFHLASGWFRYIQVHPGTFRLIQVHSDIFRDIQVYSGIFKYTQGQSDYRFTYLKQKWFQVGKSTCLKYVQKLSTFFQFFMSKINIFNHFTTNKCWFSDQHLFSALVIRLITTIELWKW